MGLPGSQPAGLSVLALIASGDTRAVGAPRGDGSGGSRLLSPNSVPRPRSLRPRRSVAFPATDHDRDHQDFPAFRESFQQIAEAEGGVGDPERSVTRV